MNLKAIQDNEVITIYKNNNYQTQVPYHPYLETILTIENSNEIIENAIIQNNKKNKKHRITVHNLFKIKRIITKYIYILPVSLCIILLIKNISISISLINSLILLLSLKLSKIITNKFIKKQRIKIKKNHACNKIYHEKLYQNEKEYTQLLKRTTKTTSNPPVNFELQNQPIYQYIKEVKDYIEHKQEQTQKKVRKKTLHK